MLFRHAYPADGLDRLVALLKAAAAFIVSASRRISADHQERYTCLQTFMADTGRNHDGIAGANLHRLALVAAKLQLAEPRAIPSTS